MEGMMTAAGRYAPVNPGFLVLLDGNLTMYHFLPRLAHPSQLFGSIEHQPVPCWYCM